jgi:hypothetical protein
MVVAGSFGRRTGGLMDERALLKQVLDQVQRLSDDYWREFEQPRRAMGDRAWVGPSASAFEQELDRHHQLLQSRLRESVELVQDKLRHAAS